MEKTPILVDVTGRVVSNKFLSLRSARVIDGKRIKIPGWIGGPSIEVRLPPGEATRGSFFLGDYYSISSEGTYRLVLVLRPNSSKEEILFSNMIEVKVQKPAGKARDK
jgi:hypothetical protein